LSLFTLAGCHSDVPAAGVQASPASTASPATAASDAIVRLSPSQLEQVHIEAISTTAPDDAIRATGVVEFNADRMARILPPVAGQVRDLAVNVGDTVAKDAVLFVLSSREVAAAIADHRASHKDLELAEKTYAMTQDLFEHQAASHIAQQQAENELAKAKARVLQTEEVLQVLGLDGHPDEDATHL
jgi:cobalt-zinc-cadmium efflux system membrane fusion protein